MSDVERLTDLLGSSDTAARLEAAQRLAEMGEEAQAAALALVECLKTGDDELQEWAVAALEQLGPPMEPDVPGLTELVGWDGEQVGYWACTLLGRSGSQATSAAPILASAITSSAFVSVQQRAAWALGRIPSSDPTVTDALQAASTSNDARLSRLAQAALKYRDV